MELAKIYKFPVQTNNQNELETEVNYEKIFEEYYAEEERFYNEHGYYRNNAPDQFVDVDNFKEEKPPEIIVEERINEENWYDYESVEEHRKNEQFRFTEDEVEEIIEKLLQLGATYIRFDPIRTGVDFKIEDGNSHWGANLARRKLLSVN